MSSCARPQRGESPGRSPSAFGERMNASGWTAEYLAGALGVSGRTMARWITGDEFAPRRVWMAIDEAEEIGLPRRPRPAEPFVARMESGGWTVQALARALDVHEQTVRKWRAQERQAAAYVYLALAAAERRGFPRTGRQSAEMEPEK